MGRPKTGGYPEAAGFGSGAGVGGNGTIIGSAFNVVTVALSEKTRTPITPRIWMRAGLPVMVATCLVGGILFAVFFGWMSTP